MTFLNFTKKHRYIKTNYLSSCDVVNKYNLACIYQKPAVEKIVISLSLKNFLLSKTFTNSSQEIKSTLLLFLLYSLAPFISYKNVVVTKNLIDNNGDFKLKIVLNNTLDINSFLFFLFYENNQKLDLKTAHDSFFLKDKKTKNIEYTFNFLLRSLSVIKGFDEVLTDINLRDVHFFANFNINVSCLKVFSKTSFLKNLPFFWING